MGGRLLRQTLPPDVAVVGQRHVGEDRVLGAARDRVGVRLRVGPRRDAEEPGFGVDRAQHALRVLLDPGDVVADRGHLPAFQLFRRHQHGEVGLAAGAREGGAEIGPLAGRRVDAHDQHMLGEPAFVARHHRGDAQRETLLAEQRIAAVARSVRPDLVGLGEVDDVLAADVALAGPGRVLLPRRERSADRMHAGDERAVAEHVEHGAAHARHDPHVDHDIGTVGDLHADLGDRRAERPHAERDDVHRAAAHAAVEESHAASSAFPPAAPSCWWGRRRPCWSSRCRCAPRPARRRKGASGRDRSSDASRD